MLQKQRKKLRAGARTCGTGHYLFFAVTAVIMSVLAVMGAADIAVPDSIAFITDGESVSPDNIRLSADSILGDDGTAAACLALIIRHQGLGRDVFDRQVAVTGRSCKDPVAQNGVAKLKGLKKIWVLTFVHICFSFPFSLSSAVSFVSVRVNCLSFTV